MAALQRYRELSEEEKAEAIAGSSNFRDRDLVRVRAEFTRR